MVAKSELDGLHMNISIPVVPTPAIAVAAQTPEVQEDQLDTTVLSEAEPDLPGHEIKTEGSSSIKEGVAVQDSSLSDGGEGDRTAEVEPRIIPAITEESPAQIEEDRPVLAALEVRQLPPSSVPTDH